MWAAIWIDEALIWVFTDVQVVVIIHQFESRDRVIVLRCMSSISVLGSGHQIEIYKAGGFGATHNNVIQHYDP